MNSPQDIEVNELELQKNNIKPFQTSDNNFGVAESYGNIGLLSIEEKSSSAKIILNNEIYEVEWDSIKNEVKFIERGDGEIYIKIKDLSNVYGKISLLVDGNILKGILEETPYTVTEEGEIFFITSTNGNTTELLTKEGKDTYIIYNGFIVNNIEGHYGNGYILTSSGLGKISNNQELEYVDTLSFGDGEIINVTQAVENINIYNGIYNNEEIYFYFFPNREVLIPHLQINETACFIADDKHILSPKHLIGLGKIELNTEIYEIDGKKIYKFDNNGKITYSDGKNIYILHENNFIESHSSGEIKENYNNDKSEYNGLAIIPLSHLEKEGKKEIKGKEILSLDIFRGEYGKDYLFIEKDNSLHILLLNGEDEILINLENRREEKTENSDEIGKGQLIGFHPKEGIIVIGKQGETENRSNHRYYTIDSKGNMIYIGNKFNVFSDFTMTYTNKSDSTNHNYELLKNNNGQSINIQMGTNTFIALSYYDKGETKYCLASLDNSEEDLAINHSIDIKIENIENLDKLKKQIPTIPKTDIVYNEEIIKQGIIIKNQTNKTIIKQGNRYIILDTETLENSVIPEYHGLEIEINSKGAINYKINGFTIQLDSNNKPIELNILGEEYYKTNENSIINGKNITHLVNINSKIILPFIEEGNKYEKFFGKLNVEGNGYIKLTENGLYIDSTDIINFDKIGREKQDGIDLILLKQIFNQSGKKLFTGINIIDLFEGNVSDSIYVSYIENGENIVLETELYINTEGNIEYNNVEIEPNRNGDILITYIDNILKEITQEDNTVPTKKDIEKILN